MAVFCVLLKPAVAKFEIPHPKTPKTAFYFSVSKFTIFCQKNYTNSIIRFYQHLCGKLCGKVEELWVRPPIFTKFSQ